MNSEIFEKYKKVQEKFSLPQFTELRNAFKFDIDNEEEMFEQIRMEVSEKLFMLSERIVEHTITGSDSLCCLFEQNMISKKEREELFEIYKKMQVLKWENNLLLIHPNERETIKWIKKTWELWNNDLERVMTRLCKKLSNGWEDLRFEPEKTLYHG